jgi:hypothetical protein
MLITIIRQASLTADQLAAADPRAAEDTSVNRASFISLQVVSTASEAMLQVYAVHPNGCTSLLRESHYSDERAAAAAFDKVMS